MQLLIRHTITKLTRATDLHPGPFYGVTCAGCTIYPNWIYILLRIWTVFAITLMHSCRFTLLQNHWIPLITQYSNTGTFGPGWSESHIEELQYVLFELLNTKSRYYCDAKYIINTLA